MFGEYAFTFHRDVEPKDDKKIHVIAQATFALVEKTGLSGLSGLTMAAIAREAGLATGTLYVHYKSQEELLVALCERAKTETAAGLMQGDDPDARLAAAFGACGCTGSNTA